MLLAPSLQILTDIDDVPSQSSLLKAQQAQLPQPFLVREMLQTLKQLCSSFLDVLQELLISVALTVEPGTGHHSRCDLTRADRGQDHLPCPAGNALPDAPQGTTGLSDHEDTACSGRACCAPGPPGTPPVISDDRIQLEELAIFHCYMVAEYFCSLVCSTSFITKICCVSSVKYKS